jgi:Ca-activated chloride channel homolog
MTGGIRRRWTAVVPRPLFRLCPKLATKQTIMSKALPARRYRFREGVMAIPAIFCAAALLVLGAVSFNLLVLDNGRQELQDIADLAALSGARQLLESGDTGDSRDAVVTVGQSHRIYGREQQIIASEVEFGQQSYQSSGKFLFVPGASPFDAVRVSTTKTARGASGAIPVFGSWLVGRESVNAQSIATACYANHDLALVVDGSGMMHGPGRFSGVQAAMAAILAEARDLQRPLRLSLTVFSKDADAFVPLTTDYSQIENEFDQIKLRGPRNVEAGLREALRGMVSAGHPADGRCRSVIMLTECKSTLGDPVAVARLAKKNNIAIHVFTFTHVADEDLADKIAAASGGVHFHALTTRQMAVTAKNIITDVPVFLID